MREYCVCVCVAYPQAILMLEMETNTEQSILLSYNKHSFTLVYSTVHYCTATILLTIYRFIANYIDNLQENYRRCTFFWKISDKFQNLTVSSKKYRIKICQNKTR